MMCRRDVIGASVGANADFILVEHHALDFFGIVRERVRERNHVPRSIHPMIIPVNWQFVLLAVDKAIDLLIPHVSIELLFGTRRLPRVRKLPISLHQGVSYEKQMWASRLIAPQSPLYRLNPLLDGLVRGQRQISGMPLEGRPILRVMIAENRVWHVDMARQLHHETGKVFRQRLRLVDFANPIEITVRGVLNPVLPYS